VADRTVPGEDIGSLLALYLIDLRAQYEAELRSLTQAQRALEQYRGSSTDEARRQFRSTLMTELRRLETDNGSVRHALTEALRQAGMLAPRGE
jgi:septal ring factor EnvC (AmiA/AmiB activator)